MLPVPAITGEKRKSAEPAPVATKKQVTAASRYQKVTNDPAWAPNALMEGSWNIVSGKKAKRTLWELQGTPNNLFIMPARVFSAAVDPSVVKEPDNFQTKNKLKITTSMPTSGADWLTADKDYSDAYEHLKSLRHHCLKHALLPLLRDDSTKVIQGLPKGKVEQLRKQVKGKSDDEAVTQMLDNGVLCGKGASDSSDFINFSRTVYANDDGELDEMSEQEYRSQGLDVLDHKARPMAWPYSEDTLQRDHVGLLWFRVLFQCVAGNIHLSCEPRRFMHLSSAASKGTAQDAVLSIFADSESETD